MSQPEEGLEGVEGEQEEGVEEEEEIKPAKQVKPPVKTVWNNRSEEDFDKKNVFDGYDDHKVVSNIQSIVNTEVKRFLRKVDTSKVPIQKSVFRMFRIRAPDYSASQDKDKGGLKEWLYWEENWNEGPDHFAKDHTGQAIAPVAAHVEGMYYETLVKEVIEVTGTKYDEEGIPIPEEQMRRRFNGLRPRYYVPFTKKTAEDVIKKSAYSNENGILFMVKLGRGDFMAGSGNNIRHAISEDMFLNWTWDELVKWMSLPGGKDKPVDYTRSSIIDKSGKSLAFTPS